MAILGQVIQTPEVNSLSKALREQLRYEINGVEITNPEKFALEQKFGLTDPQLTHYEKQLISEEAA